MTHVIPLNDTREHQHDTDCWCEPYVEWINPETELPYPAGPLVVHESADLRELRENLGYEPVEGKGWGVFTDEQRVS